MEDSKEGSLEVLPVHEVTVRDLVQRGGYFYKDLHAFFEGHLEGLLTNDILADWWNVTFMKHSRYREFQLPFFSDSELLDIKSHLEGRLTEKDIPKDPFADRFSKYIAETGGAIGFAIGEFREFFLRVNPSSKD